ncbi:cupredoxin domain-containing protein [Halospeciosus flavus]|uniref:Plastocyanin/azurin family copper-binding protein n=1 Tax=Halospeciosus flavus TaxID=3032283 RepID=A0ABD5Z4K7_9EURY|nr:plastocyanin/azurin family copper-binding protein [Halospeciosus flavus]
MRRRTFLAAVGTAAAVGSAGCVGRAVTGIDYDVGMRSDAFVPQNPVDVPDDAPHWVPADEPTVEVRVGEPLVWYNTGARNHTVTAATTNDDEIYPDETGHHHTPQFPDGAAYFASGGFDTERAAVEDFRNHLNGGGMIPPGETYEHTFETPGWYHYFCIPHRPAGMMGNVHVVD